MPPSSWLTQHWRAGVSALLGLAVFVALFALVAHAPGAAGAAPASAAAMLAVITAAALGIERVLEVFWTLAGQLASAWWPFNKVFRQVTALEADVKARVAGLQAEIAGKLAQGANLSADAQARLAAANAEMVKLQARLAELEELAPGNQQVSLVAATIVQGIGLIQQHQPALDFNFRLIDQSVAGLTDFVASFKDNPARRLISIWAGALLGLAVAYFVRLDVFLAVLGADLTPAGWWAHLEIALTGLIIGLGSNPTHDVIAALQEVKKYRASQNQPGPVWVAPGEVLIAPPGLLTLDATPGPRQRGELPPVRRFR